MLYYLYNSDRMKIKMRRNIFDLLINIFLETGKKEEELYQ